MKRVYLALACVVLSLSVGAPLHADEPGFVSLFDGKTLKGWTVNGLPKDKELAAKAWTVDNGTILANSMGHTEHFYILLATDREYGDFVLRLRIQVERGVTGKLWNEGPGPHRWLSNEPVEDLKFAYADEGDGWNDVEIAAKGMRIKSVLNGVTVVDYDGSGVLDDELHRKHNVGTKGVIGLQLHSYHELKLRFKDVRIKPLQQARSDFLIG